MQSPWTYRKGYSSLHNRYFVQLMLTRIQIIFWHLSKYIFYSIIDRQHWSIPLNFLSTFPLQSRKILFPIIVLKTIPAKMKGSNNWPWKTCHKLLGLEHITVFPRHEIWMKDILIWGTQVTARTYKQIIKRVMSYNWTKQEEQQRTSHFPITQSK
jgi:hypothetical protein